MSVAIRRDRGVNRPGPVTLTADAARTLALTGGVPDLPAGAALVVPLSVWRWRRMS